jgi:excisionase family DNA binding protein
MTPEDLEADVITAAQVAQILGLNLDTVYRYAKKKKIPCRRLGVRYLFSKSALMVWLGCKLAESAEEGSDGSS